LFSPLDLAGEGGAGAGLRSISAFEVFGYRPATVFMCVIVLLVVLTGYAPRWVAPVWWWVSYSVFVSVIVVEGGEQICAVATLLLIPLVAIDRRRSRYESLEIHASRSAPLGHRIAAFSVFLIQLQVTVIYGHSLLAKLGRQSWQEGTAVYYFMQDSVFGPPSWLRPQVDSLLRYEWGSPMLTWGTLGLEAYLAAAPWFRSVRARRTALWIATAFHASIVALIGLPSFFLAAVGINVLALNPWEARREPMKVRWFLRSESPQSS
jgi:antimicrobial peptide system SdpB family protein